MPCATTVSAASATTTVPPAAAVAATTATPAAVAAAALGHRPTAREHERRNRQNQDSPKHLSISIQRRSNVANRQDRTDALQPK
jgi:hypothetical protein